MLASLILIAALSPGNHTFTVHERTYIAHVPTTQGALPVIINLHGGGSNAESQQRYSSMDAVADREHFIAVLSGREATTRLFDRIRDQSVGTDIEATLSRFHEARKKETAQ